MTWSARRRAWEAKRLGPALDRAPERRTRFSTISDTEVERLYGPWSWAPSGAQEADSAAARKGISVWAMGADVSGAVRRAPGSRGPHAPLGCAPC